MTLSPHPRPIPVTRIILVGLAILGAALPRSSQAQDYTAELAAVEALGDLTTAPAMYTDDTMPGTLATVSAGERKAVFFDALDYLGNPTRVYAWVGIPAGASAGSPVPGMVLVHGGGGTAHEAWVQKWTDRGYAAISIAVEGQTDTVATQAQKDAGQAVGNWLKHAMPGPARGALYNDSPNTLTDQWMYHAVADCVLANSLLRSLPEVNAAKVGLSGFSWGGVITSTVIGIDDRFAFAIPTYGCGHKYDSRNYYGANLANNERYKQVWDPMIRIANATMPVLWFSWPEEPHFLMDSLAYTYHGAPGTRMVSLKPGMGHGSNWHSPEYYDYADSIVFGSGPWCEQQSLNLAGNTATAVFTSTKALHTASLIYRTSNQPIITGVALESPNPWTEIAADSLVESPPGTWTVTATLPAGVTGWFVNVEATGSDTGGLYGYNDANITASSDYQEINTLILNPAGALAIEHPLANDQTTGIVQVAYTGPANVEVSSITIGGESHPGAFTSLATAPLVMLNPTPAQTPVTIQFDNTVAGLTEGQTATATLTIVWDELDGSTDQISLPLSATAEAAATVIYDASADWSSQSVNSYDDVIIRNGATVTVGEPGPPPNLITNGSFETPDAADGSFIINNTTGPLDANWTIVAGGVTVVDSWDTNQGPEPNTSFPSESEQFLQLQGTIATAGTISQTFATTPGATYELTFDYSSLDFASRSTTITYDVGGGAQTANFSSAAGQVPWATETFQFTATAASTTLTFTGQQFSGFWGPGIDNVSVTKIAEPNLVVNGSFEPPDSPDLPFNGIGSYGVGNTSLTGWTIADTSVWLIDHWDRFGNEPNTVASDGDQYLQLQDSGTGVATISQDITTVIGETYELAFDYSGVDTATHSVDLAYAVGGPVQTVTYSTGTPMLAWQTETYSFEATSTTTTISFTGDSVGGGFYGTGIDNVRVTEVPSVAAANITVNDDASPITATLAIDQDIALTAGTSMVLGAGTGAGFVNQSTGSVTTPDLTINGSGTGDLSQYNLSGGSVDAAAITVNDNGALNLTGGTVTNAGTLTVAPGGLLDIDGGTFVRPGNGTIDGYGLIKLQSGTFSAGDDTSDGQILKTDVEISGGTFSMLNQVIFSQGQPLEFKVIGDDASITMRHLQFSGYTGSQGTLKWVLDETGVSPINVTSWMFLDLAKIVVDGAAYTGGAGTFPLLDSTAFLGLALPGNITVTGFGGMGLDATVVQDDVVEEAVELALTLNAYGTWITGFGVSGADAHMAADPDGDGCNNLKEFALGGDPTDTSYQGVLQDWEENMGVMEFTYLRRVDWASEGLTYTVKTTTDLIGWGTDGLGVPAVDPTDPVSAYEWVTVPVSADVDRRYVRLEIEGL